MTRVKTEYSKPDIVKSSGKSDIFHQSPIAESEKKSYLDRNASTIFSSEPIPTQRPARKRSGFESNSDIFYDAKPVNHFEAAPSAEVYYPSGHDTTNDYEKVESSRLESLANFEEQFNFEKRRQMPPQQSHSDIFSHNVESAPSRGRRHYNSSGSATDIFNVLKKEEIPRSRRDVPQMPDWKSGSSFSNLFGGSAESIMSDKSYTRQNRNRMEPSILSRPSGLSSEDLNRDKVAPKGRPTYERSQDQFKSQIWF